MSKPFPPVLCIVGRKNSGKTEVTVALSSELMRRGHKVMTVKHGHGFQVDQPGRDSWRHRHEGGALRTVLAGPRDFAVLGHWPEGEMPLSELVSRFLWDADIVLAEGFKRSSHPRIEVFRREIHPRHLYAGGDADAVLTVAMVSDERGKRELLAVEGDSARSGPSPDIPVFHSRDPEYLTRLADFVVERFMGAPRT